MSKVRVIALFTAALVTNQVTAFSGVVTDLKSYTYYTEQIKKQAETIQKQAEMIENQKSMLKKADQTIKLAESTKKNLENAYNKAARQTKNILYDIKRAQDQPLEFAIELEDTINDMNSKSLQESISKNIDEAYKFESTSPWQKNRIVEEEAQKSIKRLMVLSEESRALNQYNLDELEGLIKDANSAETQKEATDVTNAILTEMLKNQVRIIDLLAAYQMTFAKLHYTNDTEAESNRKDYSKSDFEQEMTQGLKVNLDMQSTSKSLLDGLKKSTQKALASE